MATTRWRYLSLLALALGMSGCMLCDRYCDRQRDRCHNYCNPGCYPAPANNCAPAAGSYYPQPAHYPPANNCP